jgi:hypothetical protein
MRFDGAATAVRLRFDSLPIAACGQGLRSSRRLARCEWSGQGVEMEIRILGSFDVVGSAGVVDLRGVKRRCLLACLVVHAGQPKSTDRLVSELWGDGGSEGATRTVQTYVSQLRKLLRGEPAFGDAARRGLATRVVGRAFGARRSGREPSRSPNRARSRDQTHGGRRADPPAGMAPTLRCCWVHSSRSCLSLRSSAPRSCCTRSSSGRTTASRRATSAASA